VEGVPAVALAGDGSAVQHFQRGAQERRLAALQAHKFRFFRLLVRKETGDFLPSCELPLCAVSCTRCAGSRVCLQSLGGGGTHPENPKQNSAC